MMIAIIVVTLVGALQSARGFDVSPLVHELSPSSGKSSISFLVSNPSDRALPLEFTPHELLMTNSGAIPGNEAEEALLIFPLSALIAPGSVQAVRVQWDPDAALVSDQTYFIVVDQVAVNLPQSKFEGVQVLLSFNVVVHVKAPGSQVALVAKLEEMDWKAELGSHTEQRESQSIELAGETKAAEQGGSDESLSEYRSVTAMVSISNEGTANAFGSRMSLIVRSPDRQVVFSADNLRAEFDDLFFPPEHRRILELRLPDGDWREPVSVEVDYDESL